MNPDNTAHLAGLPQQTPRVPSWEVKSTNIPSPGSCEGRGPTLSSRWAGEQRGSDFSFLLQRLASLLPLLIPGPSTPQARACQVARMSPDLPWWVVSPFKCPFPEQPVPTVPGCEASRPSLLESFNILPLHHPSRLRSFSPCATVGFFGGNGDSGGTLFQSLFCSRASH